MKFKTGQNLPPILKIVTHTAQLHVEHVIVAKPVTGVLFLVQFNNFDQTTGFYWSYTLLLKPAFLCTLAKLIQNYFSNLKINYTKTEIINPVLKQHGKRTRMMT